MRRTWGALALACAAAVTGALAVAAPSDGAGLTGPPQLPAPGAVAYAPLPVSAAVESVITVRDGTRLPDTVTQPLAAAPPTGWPVILMPAPWGGQDTDQVKGAALLAGRGYVVVTYTMRGFKNATGQVEAQGPGDVTDASDVLTWALRHTPADPARAGIGDQSGGAGLALLAAAADPRFRVVVSLSGYTDLLRAVRPNNTPSSLTVLGMELAGVFNGRLSADTQRYFDDIRSGVDDAFDQQFAAVRSPIDQIAALDRNHPAILFIQGWNDSSFPPDQIVDFYRAYTGPKRLELRPGDHSSPEGVGITDGDPTNAAFADAGRWFDAYLGGHDQTLRTAPPVLLEPRTESGPAANEYGTDPAGSSTSVTYALGKVGGLVLPTGTLSTASSGTWTSTIHRGLNLLPITAGSFPLFPYAFEETTGQPPRTLLAGIARDASSVWETAPLASGMQIRGEIGLHLRVTPAAATGTLIAYVYDVDSTGEGVAYAVVHTPYTWTGQTAGKAFSLDVTLPPQGYDIPAGHRFALVLSMSDPLYTDANAPHAAMSISNGSSVTIPLR